MEWQQIARYWWALGHKANGLVQKTGTDFVAEVRPEMVLTVKEMPPYRGTDFWVYRLFGGPWHTVPTFTDALTMVELTLHDEEADFGG